MAAQDQPDIMNALSEAARDRLETYAREAEASVHDLAVRFLEGALAAEELEAHVLRQRLAEANSGGGFVQQADILRWLEARAHGQPAPVAC